MLHSSASSLAGAMGVKLPQKTWTMQRGSRAFAWSAADAGGTAGPPVPAGGRRRRVDPFQPMWFAQGAAVKKGNLRHPGTKVSYKSVVQLLVRC